MSGTDHPPPPGSPAPGWSPPPPGWNAPTQPISTVPVPSAWGQTQPGWAPVPPPPGMMGAAHKPGAMPLRPLGLGDMYDAAFKIIRYNPAATVGSAVLVAAVSMAIPVLITAVLTFATDLALDPTGAGLDGQDPTVEDLLVLGPTAAQALGGLLSGFGMIFVTGMVVHVTKAAAVGRRLTLGQAWAATRGRRWRLVGLSALLGAVGLMLYAAFVLGIVLLIMSGVSTAVAVLAGLGGGLLFVCLLVWLWVRAYYLAVPPLMLERVGVLHALGRAWRLTSGFFWRTFGIALLTVIITAVAGSMLQVPGSFLGAVLAAGMPDSRYAMLVLVSTQSVATVMATAFTAPFTAAVTSLQYLDLRMRREAYDIELMAQAGITGP